jgi:pimeloyl-ACP methyl ester carboxylesterase
MDTSQGQLHYAIEGEGPALVLLHPTGRSLEFYRPIFPLLSSSRQVIAIDTPGFGNSDPPPRPLSVEQYADRTVSLADHLGLDTFDLFGSNTGAAITIEIAATRPERIRNIGLMAVPYFVDAEMRGRALESVAVGRTISPDGTELPRIWESSVISKWKWAAHRFPQESQIDDAVALARSFLADHLRAGRSLEDGARAAFSYDASPKIAKLRCPTLVIGFEGESDPDLPAPEFLRQSAVVAELIPATKFVILPAPSASLSMLTALDPLATALNDFFAS